MIIEVLRLEISKQLYLFVISQKENEMDETSW